MKYFLKQLVRFLLSLYQFIATHFKRKPVVLLMDRNNAADDNAEAMFHYLKSKKEYKVYFVLKKGCKDWERLRNEKHLVNRESLKYLLLYLKADVVMTSFDFLEPRYFILCKNKHCKLIWLQHGVGKDDISRVYNASTGHDLVTLATRPEYEDRLGQKYGYIPSQLVITGLAHWDLLNKNTERVITICLTWRKYIKKCGMQDFLKSDYYSMWEDLVVSSELFDFANRYGYRVQFLFHYEFAKEKRMYVENHKHPCINLVVDRSYQDILSETALLITDYSSVAFDMAYLNKPVVYYHKDADEFFSGKHTYTAGYFDYERDGFGEVVCDKISLLKIIERYLKTDCKMNEFYLNRVKNTFVFQDQKNRERIWNKVKNKFF